MGAVSARLEYRIVSEPRGPGFEVLLTWCAATDGTCSLTDTFGHSKKFGPARDRFFDSARPWLIGVDDVDRWPGTGLPRGTLPLWKYRLEAGLVQINQNLVVQANLSYGGVKSSGLGKEASLEAMLEHFTHKKTIMVNMG